MELYNETILQRCRALSHELSNVLTFLGPALHDAGAALGALAPRHLPPDLPEEDRAHLVRQLALGGERLVQVLQGLRALRDHLDQGE